jgi:hypothetical protein
MKTQSLMDPCCYQRRIVLKGALAACCAFALPTLTGCGKREEPAPPAPISSMSPPPTPQIGGQNTPSPSTAQSASKLSKTQVQYQQQPKGDQQCSKCMHYIAESSTCKLVEGPINPNGWCTLWAQKQG